MSHHLIESDQADPVRRGLARTQSILEPLAALAILVVLLPLIAVIAMAIYLEDGGPVFFTQMRVGRGGRSFALLKFRKFAPDCGAAGHAVTVCDDKRLTRVGRFLEQSKLDELPQVWNILHGDMAFVGPRPESMYFADCFSGVYRGLLRYRPGIFGPAQALFRDEKHMYPADRNPEEFYREVLFPTKARIDLIYYPQRSLLYDVGWIYRCCLAVCGLPVRRSGCLQIYSHDLMFRARADQ